jgi:cell division protease FtsH
MENTIERLKILKKQKNSLLSKMNIPGLKLLNETEIDNGTYGDGDEVGNDFDESIPFPIGLLFIPQAQQAPVQNINNGSKPSLKKQKREKSDHFQLIQPSGYNFTHIGGCDTIKSELMQCADMLLNPSKYKKWAVDVPKGIILEGPPGNGKTHLARCFAGELNISFISVSGSQFQEMYVGVGSSRIRELFKLAKDNVPTIIFIDEIDALGRKRSTGETGDGAERDSTLNQLLVEMDGMETMNGVFVIGSTNRADLLDSALTRPGRIDKTVYVGLPDKKTREAILQIHMAGKPLNPEITIDELTEMTQGMSGAQIKNWLNEATLLAIRRTTDEQEVRAERGDLDFIMNRILVGSQSTEVLYSEKMLYQIAIHEMGHALVGLLQTEYNKLIKVSLNTWSPKSPGFTLFESKDGEYIQSKRKLIIHLSVLLAGRAAEEEFFPDHVSTGASHDLDTAKSVAFQMISKYGMGVRAIHAAGSDSSKQDIENEMNVLIDRAFAKSRLIVTHARALIEEGAHYLVSEQTVSCEWLLNKIHKKYPYLLKL